MGSILDAYSADFDGTVFDWSALNLDELDVLLENARRGAGQDSGQARLNSRGTDP